MEELLRFDSPVQFSRRIAVADFELHGQPIEAGSFVLTCLGAANHDPEQWGPTADELDLGRTARPSTCRSAVASTTASVRRWPASRAAAAFAALARRFPDLELAEEPPPWNGRIVLRGLDALPLTVRRPLTAARARAQAGFTVTATGRCPRRRWRP